MRAINPQKLYRIIDANFNRAKEGLRVCEDVCRFVWDTPQATRRFKYIRHRLTEVIRALGFKTLIVSRDIVRDVGKKTSRAELQRKKVDDIFCANAQRVKESVRVLEEFAKLNRPQIAQQLKRLRYELYALEQNVFKKFLK